MRWTSSFVLATLLSFTAPLASTALAAPLVTPLQQAVAQAASEDEAIAAFYRSRNFAPIWMGDGAEHRRAAFLWALDQADDHGLPTSRYDATTIRADFAAATDAARRGALEVEMTKRFLRYAQDVSSGVLEPKRIDPTIVLEVPKRDWLEQITAFTDGDPYAFVQGLWPTSPNYTRLLREKLRLEEMQLAGGWGATVPTGTLAPGSEGDAVVSLRNRLIRMGYLRRSAVVAYDAEMEAAVRAFQIDHGLTPDGEAGASTIAAVNVPLEDRMGQILVNLERQRWMNKPLESRHILVNLAEQHAYVYDEGKVTFDTVTVVGANTPDRRTPEFSHTMTHMVINPSWYVPRSITVNEYLPALKRGGARHLEISGRNGRVNPANIDFSQYNARNFPFSLRQPPGPRNALGRVKFMFPNQWNIYLHDTPARDLFSRDQRTFSHGCVRIGRPLELAYHLLAPQSDTPKADFDRILATGREARVNLENPIGVHLVYWSAWVTPTGRANYRGDPYDRDGRVLQALRDAGVELTGSRS
ncbi:L,D-transpeptidase family protein [Jannaschia pohangensis]|uniref:Murein L,D-transpeptidase YcbB/YkuD n=1 Tax=Jannaschia pohangensis TaxID=390807 RepID=A0A1I3GJM2_9RHOB|nr:L,D-transpeptidase family protein [Jannaschia pohangensis]SFI23680.1 Murein L,D-transpeptidase YcbB/YkuD [Jannaschia pohangensis]